MALRIVILPIATVLANSDDALLYANAKDLRSRINGVPVRLSDLSVPEDLVVNGVGAVEKYVSSFENGDRKLVPSNIGFQCRDRSNTVYGSFETASPVWKHESEKTGNEKLSWIVCGKLLQMVRELMGLSGDPNWFTGLRKSNVATTANFGEYRLTVNTKALTISFFPYKSDKHCFEFEISAPGLEGMQAASVARTLSTVIRSFPCIQSRMGLVMGNENIYQCSPWADILIADGAKAPRGAPDMCLQVREYVQTVPELEALVHPPSEPYLLMSVGNHANMKGLLKNFKTAYSLKSVGRAIQTGSQIECYDVADLFIGSALLPEGSESSVDPAQVCAGLNLMLDRPIRETEEIVRKKYAGKDWAETVNQNSFTVRADKHGNSLTFSWLYRSECLPFKVRVRNEESMNDPAEIAYDAPRWSGPPVCLEHEGATSSSIFHACPDQPWIQIGALTEKKEMYEQICADAIKFVMSNDYLANRVSMEGSSDIPVVMKHGQDSRLVSLSSILAYSGNRDQVGQVNTMAAAIVCIDRAGFEYGQVIAPEAYWPKGDFLVKACASHFNVPTESGVREFDPDALTGDSKSYNRNVFEMEVDGNEITIGLFEQNCGRIKFVVDNIATDLAWNLPLAIPDPPCFKKSKYRDDWHECASWVWVDADSGDACQGLMDYVEENEALKKLQPNQVVGELHAHSN